MSEPPVKFDNVEKLYGSQAALESLSLDVQPGERLALVGHNGAGKTTTMKLMLGLIRPSRGSVRVLGVDPRRTARRRSVAPLASCRKALPSMRR